MSERILILNVGSSSVKYDLYEGVRVIRKGNIDKIGERKGKVRTFEKALRIVFEKCGIPDVIGHRVVHGGKISKTSKINDKLIKAISKASEFAPLHNPNELKAIRYCTNRFRSVPQYALFDSCFFRDLPEVSKRYALKGKKFFRKGFHGWSHQYCLNKSKELLKKKSPNLVICHLGNGCSLSLIERGKVKDTSMGYTPLEGVIMGTRSGSVDLGIVFAMLRKGLSFSKVEKILNEKSGLYGVSGKSKEVDVLKKYKSKKPKLALEMFAYSVAKQIGAYAGLVKNLDAIVFTGGIGSNEEFMRKKILSLLKGLDLKSVKVLHFKTNEAVEMMLELKRVL